MAKKIVGYARPSMISIDGAPYVPVDSLTPEEYEYAFSKITANLKKQIQEEINKDPDVWNKLEEHLLKKRQKEFENQPTQ